ncbi:Heat shock protein 67Bb [Trypanosoma rangeli]|uniref:Heat shock protein 67Bb n=1 Tax=Trypanosoma rangeli TaxID=5698 RepID=A0A3R7LB88_TRYRA|nr:Heat shock protein 67Bb [Trypanosoma rangeli]RNF10874.1 Heat shock protein 67Bb [Trypanosoma rangeli]|eukprot:RNF10874.1 Heat shock protein 67Bb [Trypanosoma rangeli]
MQQLLTYEDMKTVVESKLQGQLHGTHLIDVRDEEEVESTGMIPGAVNVPLDQLEAALKSDPEEFQKNYAIPKPPQDDKLVVYCLSGKRAEKGEKLARECGYTKTAVYPGSWNEWSKHADEHKEG